MTWQLTDKRLITPTGMAVPRSDIDKVRTIISAAQVVTHTGDKYMIKYQADPQGVAATRSRRPAASTARRARQPGHCPSVPTAPAYTGPGAERPRRPP